MNDNGLVTKPKLRTNSKWKYQNGFSDFLTPTKMSFVWLA